MRFPRSVSSSPQKRMVDLSIMSISNRTLRSSTCRSRPCNASTFNLQMQDTSPSRKRSWSSFSSDSISSSEDALDMCEQVHRRAFIRDDDQLSSKPRQSQPRVVEFPTTSASPDTSVSRLIDVDINPAVDMISFLDLPTEVHQQICDYLPTDKDVANYAQICTKTSAYANSSVWRKRFLREFDPITDVTPKELHLQYQERRRFEQRYVEFDDGPHPLHHRCLAMLRDLIIQSDARKVVQSHGKEVVMGLNHDFIRRYTAGTDSRRARGRGTNIVDAICNTDFLFQTVKSKSSRSSESLVLVIQLCLLHLSLDPTVCNARAHRFGDSQEQVYKCYRDQPVFKGKNKGEVNLPWLLHIANFFKFHFKQHDGEGMLSHAYDELEESELPRPWSGKLKAGTQELGKHWKGAFAYMVEDDLEAIRDPGNDGREILIDETSEGNNGFQDLTLFFDIKDHPELHFTEKIERVLHGKPIGPLRDALTGKISTPDTKDFFGLGYDGTTYHFNGRLHSLLPQQGIPGFQRVTMMKYLPDENGNYGFGRTSGWAYEGCVLPGNEIMLGRWCRVVTDPTDDGPSYSGPFIFWGVKGSAEDKLKDATTALKFLDSIGESTIW